MGLFKKLKKVVKKVAPIAVPAAAAYFGAPYLSSALGGAAAAGTAATEGGISGILKSVAPLASSVISGGLGYLGQQQANEMNREIAEQNSAFNAQQADQQMAFQAQMANTTWQRGVADMQAAGLNPMLAYSQGGAPAPSGAAGHAVQPAEMRNSAGAGVAAAAQAVQMDQTRATTENIEADTANKRAELAGKQGSGQLNDAMVANLRANTTQLIAQADLTANQVKKVIAEVNLVLAQERNTDAETAVRKINEILQKHDLPRMQAEAAYFKTPVGRQSPHNKYGPQTPFRLLENIGGQAWNSAAETLRRMK